MKNVNTLPTERFGVPFRIAGSITNDALESAWISAGEFDRLCVVLGVATAAGANTVTVTLQRASDASGTGAETAATLYSKSTSAALTAFINYGLDREKGNAKRFVRLRVSGSSANALALTALGLAFDTAFSPANLLNAGSVEIVNP